MYKVLKILAEQQAHAPLEASGEGSHGVKFQIRINRRKHRRFQWLHDAICWASCSLVDRDYSRSVCVPVAEIINGYPDALNP